jgi:DNA-directed RNA polymerase subunit RPC12/RpoP
MPKLIKSLIVERCPYCSVANPNLDVQHGFSTTDHSGHITKHWASYKCGRCGGVVTAWAIEDGGEVVEIFPKLQTVEADVPDRPRDFLEQAIASIHAPEGAVMLSTSAVDAMLTIKGYTEGSLNARINKAAEDHLITKEMAAWAHDVRLDANDQRHADEASTLPSSGDAQRVIDFAMALAEFLFVLPEKVRRGRENKANK